MRKQIVALVVTLLVLLVGVATAGEKEHFDPSTAHAVIIGVLEFQDRSLGGWPAEKRKDQELHDTLLEMGVPAGNMSLLLDKDATLANIKKAVTEVSARAGKGSTFIFYYAGHGVKQPGGKTFFANYDIAGRDIGGTGLAVDTVGELLKANFKGKRVLLWADCCYSGALGGVAAKLGAAGIPAASVTSADESNTSTNNWTFTMTVLHTLMGQGQADRNRDSKVTLAEMNMAVADSLKYRDSQKSGYSTHSVSPDLVFAEVAVETVAGVGWKGWPEPAAYVKATRDGKEKAGQVVSRKGDKYTVEFWSYNDIARAKLAAGDLKRIKYVRYSAEAEVEVLWGGSLYKARILEVEGDFHRITYPGWSSDWDEWVMSNRIVEPEEADGGGGQMVHVEWGGQWWPAEILKQQKDRYYISYPGWEASWNEWVTKERIRFP